MPLPPQLQSDVMALVATIPTVKEAVLTKQGIRNLRDELLYRHPKNPLKADDSERLQALGLNQLLMDWLVTDAGRPVFDDIKKCGPDALLQAFDAGLKQVELVQLTLAYVASVDDAVRYHKWFNQVLNRPVMLDIRLNPQLLAGVMFVYQNHLYDYSLRRQMPQLQQILLDKYKQLATAPGGRPEAEDNSRPVASPSEVTSTSTSTNENIPLPEVGGTTSTSAQSPSNSSSAFQENPSSSPVLVTAEASAEALPPASASQASQPAGDAGASAPIQSESSLQSPLDTPSPVTGGVTV